MRIDDDGSIIDDSWSAPADDVAAVDSHVVEVADDQTAAPNVESGTSDVVAYIADQPIEATAPESFVDDSIRYLGPAIVASEPVPVSTSKRTAMPSPQDYINDALAAGIPLEAINSFLAQNPGDYHRLRSALAETLVHAPGDVARAMVRANYGYGQGGIQTTGWLNSDAVPRELIATAADSSLVTSSGAFQPEGWRDVIGPIVGALPIPGAGIAAGIIGRLPMPGGSGRPQLPPGRGTPPVIDIPIPSRGRPPMRLPRGAGKVAAIAAAAAALGLTLEQYLALHPQHHRRHMNPLNPKALRRSLNRVKGFEHFVKRARHEFTSLCSSVAPRRQHGKGCKCARCR